MESITIGTIIFLILLSYFSKADIGNYFTANKANSIAKQDNFTGALNEYNKIDDKKLSLENRDILNLDKAQSYFRIKNYEKSLEYLNKISTGITSDVEFLRENIEGAYNYETGKIGNSDEVKLKLWEKSLQNYKDALDIDTRFDKTDTKKNYDFVGKEIKKLKEKLNKYQKQLDKTGSGSSESSSGSQDKQDGQNGDSSKKESPKNIDGKKWTNVGQFNQSGNENSKGYSPEEKRELEDYSNSLKDFQKNHQEYLQKGSPETQQDIYTRMLNQLSQDPLFKDVLPNNNVQKDW